MGIDDSSRGSGADNQLFGPNRRNPVGNRRYGSSGGMRSYRRTSCNCGIGTPPTDVDIKTQMEYSRVASRAAGQRTKRNVDDEEDPEDRIVNGYEAGDRTWFVSLVQDDSDPLYPVCGGALINHRYVL